MRFVLFCHSLLSDWNHGNAHFLRGVVSELCARGHDVRVYEPREAWSVQNLVREHGEGPLARVREVYPDVDPVRYEAGFDPAPALTDAEVVLVHEWNDPGLVRRLGELRKAGGRFRLLFHDTHHRSASAPGELRKYDLTGYDGVLAFGRIVRDLYLRNRWTRRAWTWHEAADVRVFRPSATEPPGATGAAGANATATAAAGATGAGGAKDAAWDLVWIGNWGDGERTRELDEFLLRPVKQLGLRALVHGVRYPRAARSALRAAGIQYGGWLPNYEAPALFSRARVTVHVPRRPYTEALPGVPTIRPFEALACGIPLVSAPWSDSEGLFRPGDYLVAKDGREMKQQLRALLADARLRSSIAARGLETIRARHTCAHRVQELFAILGELDEKRRSA